MKNFLLNFGLAALLAAGITSCSKDVEETDWSKPVESDQSFFANIAINGTETMTRAGVVGDYDENNPYDPSQDPNFDEGTKDSWIDENKVTTIYLVFYDKDGKRVSTTQVRRSNDDTAKPGLTPSENSFYSGVVQIDVKHGSLPPAYVMAFINPITGTNFAINPDFETLDKVDVTTRPSILDDDGNFAMSKSSYYGHDPLKDLDNVRITATPFLGGQLFSTREAAEKALESIGGTAREGAEADSPIVDIYVERYAAKVRFAIDPSGQKTISVDQHTLTFVPEYWAVNAYEEKTYITKSFFSGLDDAGVPTGLLTYNQLNNSMGGANAWHWNSEEHHRCYWAQSPAYYSEDYPRVADDILDKKQYAAAGGYSLGYYSYDDMVANATGKPADKARNLGDAADKERAIYVRENTVSGTALKRAASDDTSSPKAAIGSVVLVGHYTLDGATVSNNQTFYVMGNATNGYQLFKNYDEMLNYFMRTTVRFATSLNGRNTFFDYTTNTFTNEDYKKYFTIDHPAASVRDNLVIDSRFVTIQLNPNMFSESDQFYAMIDGEWEEVTAENVNDVNKQMLYAAGTVQGFKGGKAYFSIPIKHLGFSRKNNPNAGKNANDKDFKWDQVQTGDFGLVRNHSYSIVVGDIIGLGNGIPRPGDPIVPPTDPEEYFIGARITVLNWAVVPTQRVTL